MFQKLPSIAISVLPTLSIQTTHYPLNVPFRGDMQKTPPCKPAFFGGIQQKFSGSQNLRFVNWVSMEDEGKNA